MKIKIPLIVLTAVICLILRDPLWMTPVMAVCILLLLVLDLLEKRKTEKQIKELTDYITRVQDYASIPEVAEITEDSLGILQSEIYKVVTILREQYSSEHKQKKYMSDMMSDISHQFKTPLTAISLMTELLMEPGVTEEQRLEYAAKIDSQIGKITWLIRNLLTLSQLEAGVLEMKRESVVLADMVKDITESLGVLAEVAEVELISGISPEIVITADKHWLREAFSNIIKNCIEHTQAGGFVKINASRNNIYTELRIEDNGKGIEKEHLPHIFERFYKAGNSSPNSVGIGLAMAKQIINAHNGRIEAESEVGKGTRFFIRLYL
ncbi:MAG: HAMP domain-containing histidine kinase [Lachnospiraceae bacterium]|nr:HAMP domain-containing histidine kinase [Lachnospiraceae bacterium]